MTKDTLFEILGDIDDDIIIESEKNIKKPGGPWLKIGVLAACLVITVAVSIPFFRTSATSLSLVTVVTVKQH